MIENINRQDSTVRQVSVRGNRVEPAESALPTVGYDVRIREIFGENIEAHSRGTQPLLAQEESRNAFLYAAYAAFDNHYPLVISPDMIWLLIAQGFAMHLNVEAEALRHRFVAHEGKTQIVVVRDEFVRGFAGNDWEGVFAEFSQEIRSIVGAEKHALISQNFSTTGIVEQAAVEVCLMDAMQAYIEYVVTTRCGIPEFIIEGEVADWQRLRDAALRLEEYDLSWWVPHLKPLLDAFVEASEGKENEDFWGSFFSEHGGSGGPYVGGYINALFPYQIYRHNAPERNPMVDPAERSGWHKGISPNNAPNGVSVAPFLWKYVGTDYPMDFVAGFVGATQDATTLAIRPSIGWGVRARS